MELTLNSEIKEEPEYLLAAHYLCYSVEEKCWAVQGNKTQKISASKRDSFANSFGFEKEGVGHDCL